jgi:hypothetical protein
MCDRFVSSRDDSLSKGDEEEEEVLLMASVWRGVAGRRDDDDESVEVLLWRRGDESVLGPLIL